MRAIHSQVLDELAQTELFLVVSGKFPKRVAVKEPCHEISYGVFKDWMLRIVQVLKDEGVHAGDRIAVELPPGTELIASIPVMCLITAGLSYGINLVASLSLVKVVMLTTV